MKQLGIASYLRNLSVRTSRLARDCRDEPTRQQLAALCEELTRKAETLETIFEVQL
jgi:hypothetical protein